MERSLGMKEDRGQSVATQKRRRGDVLYFIEPKPERKHVVAGLIVSLVFHGALIAKPVYDYWQQVKQWGSLLSIQVVDEPGRDSRDDALDIIALTKPLYYPAWLVKPKAELAREEEERRRRLEEARRRRQEAARQAREQQTANRQTTPAAEETADQPSDLQQNLQVLQEGAERAKTLNIGPIRDQITRIYQWQQDGKIRLENISVAVNFRLLEDGSLASVRLTEPSGIPEVDNAALIIVDDLSDLRALVGLPKTESVTLRLTIGQDVEGRITAVAPSEALAAEYISQLNGLLLAARFWAATKKNAEVALLLANSQIVQEGINVIASVRIPRAEATRMFKERIGAGS
jgi:hypothetical protein